MARQKWRPQMTRSERRRGWVFFALYLLVFPYLNGWAQRLWMADGEVPVAEVSLLYYGLLFALALVVFWTFLRHELDLLLDWLPENSFAIFTGLLGAGVLHVLVLWLPYPVENPIPLQWRQEYLVSPSATILLVLLFIPLVEETLFRGLLFGSLRRYSRVLAYVVSALVYALSWVWRYALDFGDPRYLLLAVQYLPMGLGLAWCYDNGGSIWGVLVLRVALSGAMLFLALSY